MSVEGKYDVIIIGAGLSGIGAAHHLKTNCPDHSFIILEGRESIGGTWDLFRYPGIRSDSDMYTLGYSFRPWIAEEAIADGPAILSYIEDTASEDGTLSKIHFNRKVNSIQWSSESNEWTLETIHKGHGKEDYRASFIFMCTGYYNYDQGYMPDFQGLDEYKGTVIHPQKWPSGLDYGDKKIVVIGSGATAVTLVPELAKKASLVTMLQRSPTYIMTAPQKDAIANKLRKIFPAKVAYALSRWKNIFFSVIFYNVCQWWPNAMKNLLMKGVKKELGDDYDVEKHFSPLYNPWDQRLCLVPESDLFKSIKSGKSQVVTDHIERLTEKGIQLKSGQHLDADIVVSATGLNLLFMGGMQVEVDGKEVDPREVYCYRGMMYTDIPNLVQAFGYTNASWTLKCDLVCEYACRLLNYMRKKNFHKVMPELHDPEVTPEPLLDLTSNYVLRSLDDVPKQGSKRPWKLYQNYFLDIFNFRYSSLKNKELKFN